MLPFLELLDTQEEKEKLLTLYDCFEHHMYQIAYGKTKDSQKAEDLVHETFLTMTKYLDKIPEESYLFLQKYLKAKKRDETLRFKDYAVKQKDNQGAKAKAYLEAVLASRMGEMNRNNSKTEIIHMDEYLEDILESGEELPQEKVEKKEYKNLLVELLIKMKQPYKSVLYLKYYNELSAKEIGAILNLKEENVRQISKRGCDLLEKELRKRGYDGR